jgi:hypothetical protein
MLTSVVLGENHTGCESRLDHELPRRGTTTIDISAEAKKGIGKKFSVEKLMEVSKPIDRSSKIWLRNANP